MDRRVKIQKTYLNKQNFLDLVNTEFTSFTQPEPEDFPTVQDFFQLYEELYLQIPTEGETNSHRYLVNQSSKVLDVEEDLTQIQPLLDEITQLRQQVLDLQKENVNLTLELAQKND